MGKLPLFHILYGRKVYGKLFVVPVKCSLKHCNFKKIQFQTFELIYLRLDRDLNFPQKRIRWNWDIANSKY